MENIWKITALLFTITSCTSISICPLPSDLAPCTCDDEGINCMNAVDGDEIQNAFRSPGPKEHYSLRIQDTPIKNLPSGVFGNFVFRHIYIQNNKGLTKIDLRDFIHSNRILTILNLYNNSISEISHPEYVRKLTKLEDLTLAGNNLTRIPNRLFDSQKLIRLDISGNPIESIERCAFCNLVILKLVVFESSKLVQLGDNLFSEKSSPTRYMTISFAGGRIRQISKDTFTGVRGIISLENNNFTSLDETAFRPTIERQTMFLLHGNPLSCKGCSYSWIVRNKLDLVWYLPDFQCTDGRRLQNLTSSNIGC